ncbi:MAG: GtrA family protein [Proteobacteria bacterium]|nr:GtrA family protein [Pseudomonadota bacterium]
MSPHWPSRFVKFAGVGAVATAVQYAVLILCVEVLGIGAVSGSCLGFVLGAVVNYWLNYHFTFRSDNPHHVAATRFAITAAVGLALNSLLMSVLVHRLALPYLLSQVITTALVLAWTFTVNSLWSFAGGPASAMSREAK